MNTQNQFTSQLDSWEYIIDSSKIFIPTVKRIRKYTLLIHSAIKTEKISKIETYYRILKDQTQILKRQTNNIKAHLKNLKKLKRKNKSFMVIEHINKTEEITKKQITMLEELQQATSELTKSVYKDYIKST